MSDPYAARGASRLRPGTLGGRSRIASPVERRKPPQTVTDIPIWSKEAFSSLHLQRFGAGGGRLRAHVPVPSVGAQLEAGGSDGLYNYVVTQTGGNWLILKLSPQMTLIDTWDTGWAVASYSIPPEPVTARNGRIAFLASAPTNVEVKVYDTAGSVLYTQSHAVGLGLGDGACFNEAATHIYFVNASGAFYDIDLAANTATAFGGALTQAAIATQVQLSESAFRLDSVRMVETGGDLIISSGNRRGVVRVGIANEAIGTRVRWYSMPQGTGSNPDYGGIAFNADETKVWVGANSDAFPEAFAEADLITVDGDYLYSIHMPDFGGSYGATGLWRGPRMRV